MFLEGLDTLSVGYKELLDNLSVGVIPPDLRSRPPTETEIFSHSPPPLLPFFAPIFALFARVCWAWGLGVASLFPRPLEPHNPTPPP